MWVCVCVWVDVGVLELTECCRCNHCRWVGASISEEESERELGRHWPERTGTQRMIGHPLHWREGEDGERQGGEGGREKRERGRRGGREGGRERGREEGME